MKKAEPYLPEDFKPVDETYSVYGKTVKSNYPMPLPVVRGVSPDITISYEGVVAKSENSSPNNSGRVWGQEKTHALLRFYNSIGHMEEFVFNPVGTKVRVRQSWPIWRDTLFGLMNPVIAVASLLQGDDILHASSLVYEGKSTLIMGISGAGKSTLSAALATRGMSLHSDDIARVLWNKDSMPIVMAGYPKIKVEPGVLNFLPVQNLSLISIYSDLPDEIVIEARKKSEQFPVFEKWLSADELPGGFYGKSAPVNSIIILDERKKELKKPHIEGLTKASAVMALTEHMYGREWLNPPSEQTLKFCSRVAEQVPVYKVNMPDNFELLQKSAGKIFKQLIA